jgi:hypothetical protein
VRGGGAPGGSWGVPRPSVADYVARAGVRGRGDRCRRALTLASLKLPRSIVVQRGELSDADLGRARAGGLSDGEIVETVANVALNILENYVRHVARVPIDFPQSQSRQTSD